MAQSTDKLAVQHKPAEVLTENPHTNGTEKTAIKKSDIDEDLTNRHNQLSGIILPPGTSITEGKNIFERVYIPTWDNRPVEVPPIIELDGTGILTHQNITSLIALPGQGKSSLMEANVAAYLNPSCDTLGFKIYPSCRGVLYIDNERTNTDVHNSFLRACRRAGITKGDPLENTIIAGLRSVARLEHRKIVIRNLINRYRPGLLLIDGAGDLVNDTNDLKEAIECRVWMRELTVEFDLSIFVTLHPNKGTNNPRGHQGAELCRESESVLLCKTYDADIRILTTDFEHGKNRNNPKLTTAFRWSDEYKMFVSADFEEVQQGKLNRKTLEKTGELIDMAKTILPPPNSMKRTDLERALADRYEMKEATVNRRIKSMVENKIIEKTDGWYRMVI